MRDFVPQRAVLARSALLVGHAGFNTVLDALSHGVPIVAMPLAFEQPAITRDMVVVIGGIIILFAGALDGLFRRALARAFAPRPRPVAAGA